MRTRIILFLTAFSLSIHAQQTKPGILVKSFDKKSDPVMFTLTKNGKVKEVRKNHDVSVYFEKTTVMPNGREYLLKYHVRGANLGIAGDSLSIRSPQVYIHDEYKRNTDSIYDYFKNTKSGVSKMRVNSITRVYYERSQLKKVCAGVTVLSLAAAFVVAPLTSMEDGKLNLEKFRKVNRPALGVMVGAVTVGIVFSQKRMLLKTNKPGKDVWTMNKKD